MSSIFGMNGSSERYAALLELLVRAIAESKLTGKPIGYSTKGSRHPGSLTNLLPASKGKDEHESDSKNMVEQIGHVLADAEIVEKFGIYNIIYNHDEDIDPHFDFYIVPVPVGRESLNLTALFHK